MLNTFKYTKIIPIWLIDYSPTSKRRLLALSFLWPAPCWLDSRKRRWPSSVRSSVWPLPFSFLKTQKHWTNNGQRFQPMARRIRTTRTTASLRHWRPRMRFVWIVGLSLFVQSCGASWHLKRAIAKDPTILADAIVRVDTTVVTQSIRAVDTLVVRDTITREIVREGVQIKVKRVHDNVFQLHQLC